MPASSPRIDPVGDGPSAVPPPAGGPSLLLEATGRGTTITGVVLAGGNSRRMGADKALLRLDGETLLERTLATLRPLVTDLLVVGREQLPDSCAGTPTVADGWIDAGPLGGLATACRTSDAEVLLVVACDLPNLNGDVLLRLLHALPGHDAAVPLIDGRQQPLCAAYTRSIQPLVEQQLDAGILSMSEFLSRSRVRWVREAEIRTDDLSLTCFLNANTPEDWRNVVAALDEKQRAARS